MHIREYFHQIQILFDQISKISIQEILFDERSEFIGYIKGQIIFINGYRLYVSEYVDVEHTIDKIKYSYHLMQKDRIIFRYDNASDPHAKYLSTYPNHKHIFEDLLVGSEAPNLEMVLKEVISLLY
jgi:hypothetical protein